MRGTKARTLDRFTNAAHEEADKYLEKTFPIGYADLIRHLIRGAFVLYALDWGADYQVSNWSWPYRTLHIDHDARLIFRLEGGSEPWDALFQAAYDKLKKSGG
jgi:hypothetical protein